MLSKSPNRAVIYLEPTIVVADRLNAPLTFSNAAEEELLEKIAAAGALRLSDKEIAQGIVPNPDVLSKLGLSKIPKKKAETLGLKVGDGVFVIPKGTIEVDPSERDYLKPLYLAEEIHRYSGLPAAAHDIIYIRGTLQEDGRSTLLTHLERFREVMEDRRENQSGSIRFYNLHWPRSQAFFEAGPKILSVRKCASPTFTYTEREAYVMMAVNVIRTHRVDMKFLTGVLNSRLVRFWLKHKGKMQGSNFQIDKEPLAGIPIATATAGQQEEVANLVSSIYAQPESASEHEAKIDALVYRLYGLSDDEIKLIEDAVAEASP